MTAPFTATTQKSCEQQGAPAAAEGSGKRRKGGRVVQSRYLQYERRAADKSILADSSTTSVGKGSEKEGPVAGRSLLLQKCKAATGIAAGALNHSSLEKDDLQSTLLEGHKIVRPELDLSAINDKCLVRKASTSKSICGVDPRTRKKEQNLKLSDPDDVIRMQESQALLLTYARIRIEKNLAQLEEKAERNLIRLCEEKKRQQKELYELKRKLLLKEREQQLDEILDKQNEVLAPLAAVCQHFAEKFKIFATALDATRHELPVRNIYVEGDRYKYLDELQKHLAITQNLLAEVVTDYSEENSKAFSLLKELKELSLKMDEELQRSFIQVQDLSFEVSKEVSLRNQKECEETYGIETMKRWYFDQACEFPVMRS
ncbi:HAUS augmin-like complex subunit 8 [Alligator mississippiensis]|uniref:HAUS augmin-like complex subunit 8 n=1 Tax=Alligator mississippiensis TaxID=8496 RepID=A0A151NYC5_ALLMI|nr:HAUS augmin-like complex subunit 8 [Alligator mississippiensis]